MTDLHTTYLEIRDAYRKCYPTSSEGDEHALFFAVQELLMRLGLGIWPVKITTMTNADGGKRVIIDQLDRRKIDELSDWPIDRDCDD